MSFRLKMCITYELGIAVLVRFHLCLSSARMPHSYRFYFGALICTYLLTVLA